MAGKLGCFLFLSGILYLCGVSRGHGQEKQPSTDILSVSFVLSDTVILAHDPVMYKLLLHNQSKSLIYIAKFPGGGFSHALDCRLRPSERWVQAAELSAVTMGAVEGERTISGEKSFATYGQFFLNSKDQPIFSSPGDYEVRIRVKCVLGEFTTEKQLVRVGQRPRAEVEAIMKHANVIRSWFNYCSFSDPPEIYFADLRPKVHSGSVERTLKLFDGLSEFMKTRNVAGEKCTAREAFSKLSKGLDEVRRDQLATSLLSHAKEAKQWQDVADLLPALAEETDSRGTFERALQAAIRRELKKGRGP